jgi:hypothetical protein
LFELWVFEVRVTLLLNQNVVSLVQPALGES